MKSLWQFYYYPAPGSNQAKVLVYSRNYDTALGVVKKILRRDYGGKGAVLIKGSGGKYRHDVFTDITAADNQLGPGRGIMCCLPPSQMVEFLTDYTRAMAEKERTQGQLRRGEKDMLKTMKALLRQKQTEAKEVVHKPKITQVGMATAESERAYDVARDW